MARARSIKPSFFKNEHLAECEPMSDALREAIKTDGRSLRKIAKASGVHCSNISRFQSGKRGLSCMAIDRICSTLGMQLGKRKA